MKRTLAAVIGTVMLIGVATGCASKRQIDPSETNSFRIEGTSWYGFCQGRNAFIWVPSYNDTDPDELEAVIYDDYRCVGGTAANQPTRKPYSDPDGLIDE